LAALETAASATACESWAWTIAADRVCRQTATTAGGYHGRSNTHSNQLSMQEKNLELSATPSLGGVDVDH
jgi:hypothetical protein